MWDFVWHYKYRTGEQLIDCYQRNLCEEICYLAIPFASYLQDAASTTSSIPSGRRRSNDAICRQVRETRLYSDCGALGPRCDVSSTDTFHEEKVLLCPQMKYVIDMPACPCRM